MQRKWGLFLAALLLVAPLSFSADEGNLGADGFGKIVAKIEDEEARAFFAAYEGAGSRYAFPVVWDLAELTAEDLWLSVDGEKVAVERAYLCAFLRAMAATGVTMTAEGKSVRYELREGATAGGSNRAVGQTEPKSKGAPKKRKAGKKTREEAAAPVYRLECPYGDVVLSAEDAGEIYADYEVADVVDDLQFKDFPCNQDGEAKKLFRECEKKMEGLMSSASGRKGVLRTYAYYEMKDQSWKAELLEDILAHYDLGKIRKE
ncbi:MAG: hypothetical protein JSU81_04415 [Candidatus Coatesbacteria bacterium]|nr:MAG: hypothetical protein JSU81_04415 [Candidatus Coatesbacteria bacterium]